MQLILFYDNSLRLNYVSVPTFHVVLLYSLWWKGFCKEKSFDLHKVFCDKFKLVILN